MKKTFKKRRKGTPISRLPQYRFYGIIAKSQFSADYSRTYLKQNKLKNFFKKIWRIVKNLY
jgi:hypothetical protein